ncbi:MULTISPECIES: patatin-like phospholipase family protein [Bacillus]|uniref:patatin-like phospholipase family protein n=1 Tax=Bacillus TaxID=1386 RepID=UPI00191311FD|nr:MULTISPECIES: patatin family protein [Bacillus]MBK5472266.1 patatin family protein [Bacillus sp. TH19]WOA59869.1 patatin family protein [Bacillus mycoides]
MKNIGLVLEGGGMKGLYTAGVLEYFMERDLFFPYVVGVSAGACMGATYLSRQKGRNKKVNTELVADHRYISYRNLIRKRELFGMDFLFDEVPNKIVPFDFQTFLNSNEQFVIGTTDCESGQAVYYNKIEHGNDILKIIRASSSVPFIAPAVEYDNRKLLDGGIIDPIPVLKAQNDGYQKNVVIMTKQDGYEKQRNKFSGLAKMLYRKYPNIAQSLVEHYRFYNETITYMNQIEQKDNFYIIQPSVQLPISGIERNKEKLVNLYNLGYTDAQYHYEKLLNWIEK